MELGHIDEISELASLTEKELNKMRAEYQETYRKYWDTHKPDKNYYNTIADKYADEEDMTDEEMEDLIAYNGFINYYIAKDILAGKLTVIRQ